MGDERITDRTLQGAAEEDNGIMTWKIVGVRLNRDTMRLERVCVRRTSSTEALSMANALRSAGYAAEVKPVIGTCQTAVRAALAGSR